jgi:hypothetical protein
MTGSLRAEGRDTSGTFGDHRHAGARRGGPATSLDHNDKARYH